MEGESKKLTPKQKIFCEEYVVDWNASRAARVAGYSEKTAKVQASQLLTKDYISEYIKSIAPNHKIKRRKKARKLIDNDHGYVYLIHCKCTNYYKIGKTTNVPIRRLKNMQTSIPFDLELICSIKIDNCSNKESYLHWYYKHSRVRGEWFLFSPKELKGVIKKMKSYE